LVHPSFTTPLRDTPVLVRKRRCDRPPRFCPTSSTAYLLNKPCQNIAEVADHPKDYYQPSITSHPDRIRHFLTPTVYPTHQAEERQSTRRSSHVCDCRRTHSAPKVLTSSFSATSAQPARPPSRSRRPPTGPGPGGAARPRPRLHPRSPWPPTLAASQS